MVALSPKMIEAMEKRHGVADGQLHAKAAELIGRSINRDTRLVNGTVTTTDVGIDGLIVPASSLDTRYFWSDEAKRKGVRSVYYGHDYTRFPIGTCHRLTIEGESMYCSTFITRTGIGDDLLTMMEEGSINGISSGFRTFEWSPPTPDERREWRVDDDEEDVMVIRRALMLEYSIVAMPALPEATIERMVSRGRIRRDSAVAFGLPDTPRRRFYPASGPARVERVVTLDATGIVTV
jgi:HK97 family phage prohead protease